jgi:hypothetical protein
MRDRGRMFQDGEVKQQQQPPRQPRHTIEKELRVSMIEQEPLNQF